jgi:hypothetical protein
VEAIRSSVNAFISFLSELAMTVFVFWIVVAALRNIVGGGKK